MKTVLLDTSTGLTVPHIDLHKYPLKLSPKLGTITNIGDKAGFNTGTRTSNIFYKGKKNPIQSPLLKLKESDVQLSLESGYKDDVKKIIKDNPKTEKSINEKTDKAAVLMGVDTKNTTSKRVKKSKNFKKINDSFKDDKMGVKKTKTKLKKGETISTNRNLKTKFLLS